MTEPAHSELGVSNGGFSFVFDDIKTIDLCTFMITSLVMACTVLLKKINKEKHNKKTFNFVMYICPFLFKN